MDLPKEVWDYLPEVPFATKKELLAYARVLVDVGLGQGSGITAGDRVMIGGNQYVAEKFLPYLAIALIEAGGHPRFDCKFESFPGTGMATLVGLLGNQSQTGHVDTSVRDAVFAATDHRLAIKAPIYAGVSNPFVGHAGVKRHSAARRPLTELMREYRDTKWLSNTLAYFPTEALAKEADCTVSEIWQMIAKGCCLDAADPVEAARTALKRSQFISQWLNGLDIRTIHTKGQNIDLTVQLHESASWHGGTGANLPSFENFTTPMASKTSGWVRFTHPIIYKGWKIEGLSATFVDGRLTEWSVDSGHEGMEAFLDLDGTDRLGEIAATDRRLSNIEVVIPHMPMCLENLPGTMHLAFGNGYTKCVGDEANGDRNQSKLHKDAVVTGDFTMTATCAGGSTITIFKNGEYQVALPD